jgi:hypothetical protein
MRTISLLGWLGLVLIGCGGGGGSGDDIDGATGRDGSPAADGSVAGSDASTALPSDPFYVTNSIVEVRLTISAANLAALDDAPDNDTTVSGTFASMGETVANVGIRYKGNSSFARAGGKKSFKIEFDEYVADQRFLDLGEVNLNNTVLDPSMEREVSAYELFREFGVAAST